MPDANGRWNSSDAVQAITYWARKYGYSDAFLQAALAIAYGESSMNPYAHGDVDIGGSYGIYQFYTNGGRGTGVPIETLYNPWYQAEKNLPILFATFQKFGGDSGWYNNPAYVLRNTWKYGQGSIWPNDGQISGAIGSMRTLWQSQKDLFDPNAQLPEPPPGGYDTPPSTDPSTNPTQPEPTSPFARFDYPLMTGFMDSLYGGQSYSPAPMFLSGLMGGGYSPSPGSEFLQNILGDTTPQQMQPAIDYLSGLTGKLFSF